MNRDQMEEISAAAATISEKIRILYDAGVPTAEIATFLERRYQHVYNVIKDYKARRGGGVPPGPPAAEAITLSLGSDGTLLLPADWIDAEGLRAGDVIICRTEARGLLIMSRTAAIEALRDLARKHMPGEAALLDALLGGNTEKDNG